MGLLSSYLNIFRQSIEFHRFTTEFLQIPFLYSKMMVKPLGEGKKAIVFRILRIKGRAEYQEPGALFHRNIAPILL